MKTLFYILPVLAGMAIMVQSGINAQLRTAVNHPVLAAFISFLAGSLALLVLLLFSRQPLPAWQVWSTISWYKFTGGLLGTLFIVVAILSVQKIGAANLIVLVVAGQLITAVIMDQYGAFGIKVSPVTLQKICGISLVMIGAYLVNRR